ncbi:Protein PET18 [Spathaspora sp. JA1]|nr:Protein PET18 [Spathaspora sp. JA1]
MSIVDKLLEKYSNLYTESITQPLTNELCNGTLSDHRLFTYLTQDLKFFQIGLNLLGKTLAYCDDPNAAIVLGKQIGFLSHDENDYFFKSLSQIKTENLPLLQEKVSDMLLPEPITLPQVESYINLLKYMTYESASYIELITFTYVMEKVYLGWADYNLDNGLVKPNLEYKHQEWIDLHSGVAFTKWVEFLKNEVDRVVKTKEDELVCEEMFVKSIKQEISFFEGCYNYSS